MIMGIWFPSKIFQVLLLFPKNASAFQKYTYEMKDMVVHLDLVQVEEFSNGCCLSC